MKLQSIVYAAVAAQLADAKVTKRQAKGAAIASDPQVLSTSGRPDVGTSIASTFVTMVNMPYGKTSPGANRIPSRVQLAPTHPEVPGYKTVKIRYGPYKVPNMKKVTKTLTGTEEGMLWNYPDINIEKPCNDCMVVGIQADYENLKGESVNINTGHWLHHIVLVSSHQRWGDPTCQAKGQSLPHWVVGMNAKTSERIWASGNERTPVRLHDWNITDAGIKVAKSDVFSMIVDLMNMNPEDNSLYVVVKYDYFNGFPAGMDLIRVVWLDVDQCAFSEAKPKSQNGKYTVTSIPWRSNIDGEILGVGGHIHDGGVTAIIKADGKVVCDSKAAYGETKEYISPGVLPAGMGGMDHGAPNPKQGKGSGGHGHGTPGMKHISSMIACVKGKPELKLNQIKTGQMWTVEAPYDYQTLIGATNSQGQQENVMAISLMYIRWKGGEGKGAAAAPKAAAPKASKGKGKVAV